MLSKNPSIVFIDDKKDEVKGIIDIYREKGYGVVFFNASPFEGDNIPDNQFSNINIVFLDIYYKSDRILDEEKCAEWVSAIIPENSFFVLVIWSQDTDEAETVIEEIKKNNRHPFISIIKQKSEYQIEGDTWDFNKLHNDINSELDAIPELSEFSEWKNSVIRTTNIIIGHLSKETDAESLRKKMQKIIIGHGGTRLFGNNEINIKREVLFDGLDNVLISNAKENRTDTNISTANKENLYNIERSLSTGNVDTQLNSWFHFKLINEISSESIEPGLISLNNHSLFKKIYSITDDPKIVNKLTKQVENATTEIKDIVVVLNRPCDVAQNKYGKNIKLLSGIIINNPYRYQERDLSSKQKKKKKKEEYLGRIHFNNEQLPDSIIAFHHLKIGNDSDISILFDFRYVFSIPEKIFFEKFDNITIFNKELISEIQVEYSSYSSRLGITQII